MTTIAQLPAAAACQATDTFPAQQGALTVQETHAQLATFMGAHITALTGLTTPVPLTGGGTGATTPSASLTALGGAALAGSASQVFSVAPPTAATHAVPFSGGPVNVLWYGADPTGATDSTTAIGAALTYVNGLSATRACLVFPAGTYLISGSLTIARTGLIIEGSGSKIITNSATADIFVATVAISALTVSNLCFDANVTKTAGAVFNFANIANSSFQNCKLASFDDYAADGGVARLWNGFNFGVLSRVWIDNDCMIICQNNGISGSDATNSSAELQIDGRILFCNIAVYIGGGYGGVYVNGEISRGNYGFYIDTIAAGISNREMFCQPGAIIDSCNLYAVAVQNNGCALLDITGSWLTSTGQFDHGGSGGVGLYIAPSTGAQVVARITGARFYNNYVGGAVIAAGYVSFGGCWFDTIAGNALTIETSNFTGVTGCYFLNNTGYAIWFDGSTTINDFLIEGNVFSGNEAGQINLTPGASATQIVRDNLGFVTANSGSAVIPAGSTTIVVAHGLVATPAEISVTPVTTPIAAAANTAGGTDFTIQIAAAQGSNTTLTWRASLLGN